MLRLAALILSERVCQLPMHIVIDIWSVLVPGVVVLYLCNYNERKSMKPSKLYVALTFSIMAMGQILEISLQMRLEGGYCLILGLTKLTDNDLKNVMKHVQGESRAHDYWAVAF